MKINIFKKLKINEQYRPAVLLIFVVVSYIFLIAHIENISYFDSLWMTLTTVLTIGYGDMVPKTVMGKIVTMLLLYTTGVFLVSNLMNRWFEVLANRFENKLKGFWRYKMKEHIIIVGHPNSKPEIFVDNLIEQIKQHHLYKDKEFLLVSSKLDELPNTLNEKKINWLKGDINSLSTMKNANALEAEAIYFIAGSSTDQSFDSFVLDIVENLRSNGCKSYIISECVKTTDKSRFEKIGVDSVIKVMHGYPNIAAKALTAKKSPEILDDLFSEYDNECIRIDFSKEIDLDWKNVVVTLLQNNIGTPIAYIDTLGKVITNPKIGEKRMKSIFIIIEKESHHKIKSKQIENLLSKN